MEYSTFPLADSYEDGMSSGSWKEIGNEDVIP